MPFRHNGRAMELRHLRSFLAVAEALSFTKAAEQLRIAQPALSRQVQSLEEEIGVDLLKRSPRGVTLTAEGKLLLEEARDVLRRADESVIKVRALARGEYGELHIGYAPTPTVEILPPALAAFQKTVPEVKVLLHDMSSDEILDGIRNGGLQLAVTPWPVAEHHPDVEFESLKTYPIYAVLSATHPLARLKTIPLEKFAAEPLIVLSRKDYPDAHTMFERLFRSLGVKPRIALECDSGSSVITAIESGRGVTLSLSVLKMVAANRLRYRPVTGIDEVVPVGIVRARNGDVTPAGDKFCAILRKVAKGAPVRD
ncbi:MAG TPA: LysR family transcriptional regulator [Alphaproteobacteria bacterium]|nr:LysR family transcriptional regulator [Alphaproteobacteria bacterium]